MNKSDIQILNGTYQNCKTAMQSINDIIGKIRSEELIDEVKQEFNEYEKMANECENVASENNYEIKDNNWFEKAKLWTSIQMTTLTDNSDRHIAELMLMGTVMGTLTCYKDISQHKDASPNILALTKKLLALEEKNFNVLKDFLKV